MPIIGTVRLERIREQERSGWKYWHLKWEREMTSNGPVHGTSESKYGCVARGQLTVVFNLEVQDR